MYRLILLRTSRRAVNYSKRYFCSPIVKPGLFSEICPPVEDTDNKVTVVGAGKVGLACAFTLLTRGISDDVVLIDKDKKRLTGETLDLQHGSLFLAYSKVNCSTDYKSTANSKLCIITAGVKRLSTKETRFSLGQRNAGIFKTIIPELMKYSPNTILIIVANPVDIMTCIAWKLSGLPTCKVIGSGTNLDSARFRVMISEKLGIPSRDCNGFIIGEHGVRQVAVWSGVNMGGVRMLDLNPKAGTDEDPEKWNEAHQQVVEYPQQIIQLKGHTCWAIGLSVGYIAKSILRNSTDVAAVSTNINGLHGVTFDVFLSLPCVLNSNGVHKIIKQNLAKDEREKLLKTAEIHRDAMKIIKL